jgi:ring-1,2-phenylacetyl-CoA epoxidase subunit PaaC
MSSLWAAPDAADLLRDDASRAALHAYLLAAADDELILGHRHSEWTGFAPDIESDVALSSVAQDEMGHARVLYEQVAAVEGTTPDALAFGRPSAAFLNALLVERKNGDWAYTIVRAWLYDHADATRLGALAGSPMNALAGMARALQREEKYHVLFSDAWLRRLAGGGAESRARLEAALAAAWPETAGLFEATTDVDRLASDGWLGQSPAVQMGEFTDRVVPQLEALGLRLPQASAGGWGGRRGRHSADLDELLREMTSVWRQDPQARW